MERAEALKKIRQMSLPKETMEILEALAPELRESEDERIRNDIMEAVENWLPYERVEEIRFYLDKQKEASKAIEAVERIDKYIDEHLANAHDMKDSDPDKKYYRGWDDALGKMSGILQDVYSGEKQKEPTTEELYAEAGTTEKEYIANTMKMVRAMREKQKEQKPTNSYKPTYEQMEALRFAVNHLAKEHVSQSVRLSIMYDHLKEQDEQQPNIEICPHSIKSKSYKESGYPIEDCDYGLEIAENILEKTLGKVEGYQSDDGIREHQTAIEAVKKAKEQKPAECEKHPESKYFEDEWKDYYNNCLINRQPMPNKREIARHFFWFGQQQAEKPAEWSEEDRINIDSILSHLKEYLTNDAYTYYERWLKSLPERFNLQPKQEWSEEDEKMIRRITGRIESDIQYGNELTKAYGNQEISWLKSLRPSWKPSEDEERLINTTISFLKDFADKGYENAVECIDWLKSKLNEKSIDA